MKWPWTKRQELAEEHARAAEADLRKARADHSVARQVAEVARLARRENHFAEMIRTAMGVGRR